MRIEQKTLDLIKQQDQTILKDFLSKLKQEYLEDLAVYRPTNTEYDVILKGKIQLLIELLTLLKS